jgi:dipeptidyl aminopeptidase/acylaminoacyl peptidase
MTTDRRLERDLPAILGEIAMGRYPDYIDDVLATTAQRRQRPAWTFPERWLPMELVTTRVPTTRMPWRQIGVLALLGLLIATAMAIYVGSQQRRLPAPFGPAANGVVAYSHEGDIYVADPSTGNATAISSGPENDLRPIFSPDGTMVVFERKVGAGPDGHLYVAGADGTGLMRVTIDPIVMTPSDVGSPYQFSPDGRSLVVAAWRGNDDPGLMLVATDGSGDHQLDLATLADRVTMFTEPTFRPPDGREIMFVGTDNDITNGGPGVYAVNVSTGDVRAIVEADASHELDLATWSPDGQLVSYAAWDATAEGMTVRTHIVGADGTGDRVFPLPPGAVFDIGAAWSNDGTRLLLVRGYTSGWEDTRPVIIPADGSDIGTEIANDGPIQGNCCYSWKWSPDDTMIIGKPINASGHPLQQVIIDVRARTLRPAPWTSAADPMIQRRAP